ncbi:hypothetical protein HFD88_009505 [Aspergillus terreus]|nr:hypothetical protein HFD88_009505 [Aspergillus terreus]
MPLLNRKQRLSLVSFACIYFLLLLYCSFNSARDPGSAFFQPRAGYQPVHSPTRIKESLGYLSSYNATAADLELDPHATTTQNASLCVGVVTVRRPLIQTLDMTVGSVLEGLTPDQRSSLALHVLFAVTHPADHPLYQHPWVANVVNRTLTYGWLDDAPLTSLRRLEMSRNYKKKSLIDYRLALQSCYDYTDAPWIMMLEDDVLAQGAWYNHTMRSIQNIEAWKEQGRIRDWLYLRLFYTEKFLGWNSEFWPVYLGWSVAIVLAAGLTGICCRRRVRPLQEVLSNRFLAIVCLLCVPLLIGLYFLAGRVTMRPMQPGIHLMNKHGCCSQAMVFPREKIPIVANEMMIVQDWKKVKAADSVIEMVGNEYGFDRLAISPPLTQHIGAATYKEDKKKWNMDYSLGGAHGVWSMEFEKAYEQARFGAGIPDALWLD